MGDSNQKTFRVRGLEQHILVQTKKVQKPESFSTAELSSLYIELHSPQEISDRSRSLMDNLAEPGDSSSVTVP